MLTFFKLGEDLHPALAISKIARDELELSMPKSSTLRLRIHGASERDVLVYAIGYEAPDGGVKEFPRPIGPLVIPRSFVFQIVPEAADGMPTQTGVKRRGRLAPQPPAPVVVALNVAAPPPAPQLSCATLNERWQRAYAMGQQPAIVARLKQLHAECCAKYYSAWQRAAAMGQQPAIIAFLKNQYEQGCGVAGVSTGAYALTGLYPRAPGEAYQSDTVVDPVLLQAIAAKVAEVTAWTNQLPALRAQLPSWQVQMIEQQLLRAQGELQALRSQLPSLEYKEALKGLLLPPSGKAPSVTYCGSPSPIIDFAISHPNPPRSVVQQAIGMLDAACLPHPLSTVERTGYQNLRARLQDKLNRAMFG